MYNIIMSLHTVVMVSVPRMESVDEGDGMVTVCATLVAFMVNIERNFTITLTTVNGTGILIPDPN